MRISISQNRGRLRGALGSLGAQPTESKAGADPRLSLDGTRLCPPSSMTSVLLRLPFTFHRQLCPSRIMGPRTALRAGCSQQCCLPCLGQGPLAPAASSAPYPRGTCGPGTFYTAWKATQGCLTGFILQIQSAPKDQEKLCNSWVPMSIKADVKEKQIWFYSFYKLHILLSFVKSLMSMAGSSSYMCVRIPSGTSLYGKREERSTRRERERQRERLTYL